MPSRLPPDVRAKLEPIRLVVLDVDGVLTDGSLIYSAEGEERKRFSVRDGLGIRLLLRAGIQVAVISGRPSVAVLERCSELGVRSELVVTGSSDKTGDLDRMEELLQVSPIPRSRRWAMIFRTCRCSRVPDSPPVRPTRRRRSSPPAIWCAARREAAVRCASSPRSCSKAQGRWNELVSGWVTPGMQRG